MGPYMPSLSYCHLTTSGASKTKKAGVGNVGWGGEVGQWIEFTSQGFQSRGAAGVASERRHQELTSCQTQLVPAASKMVLLLPKAEPVSDSGATFVIMYLRVKKPLCSSWEA